MVTSDFRRMFKHFLLLFVHNGHTVSYFESQLFKHTREYEWSDDFTRSLINYAFRYEFICIDNVEYTYPVYSINEDNPITCEVIEFSKKFYDFKYALEVACSIRELPIPRLEMFYDDVYDVAFVIDDNCHSVGDKVRLWNDLLDRMTVFSVDNDCMEIYEMCIIQLK